MKTKKIEKKTVFLFKRKELVNLNKDQMRKINGGEETSGGGLSGDPACPNKTIFKTIGE